jgi:hypothetical protein
MPTQLPLDTSCQAEYADGYIHDETTLNDTSPFTGVNNILNDILEKRPETEHGKLVRFSVFYKDRRYDIDWTTLPENARPIRFRDGSRSLNLDNGDMEQWWTGCRFGYQYNDANGKNIQEVQEL